MLPDIVKNGNLASKPATLKCWCQAFKEGRKTREEVLELMVDIYQQLHEHSLKTNGDDPYTVNCVFEELKRARAILDGFN